jgi:hypothetical protein
MLYRGVIGNSENLMNHTVLRLEFFFPAAVFDCRIISSRLMYGGNIVLLIIYLIDSNSELTDFADYLTRIISLLILGIINYISF